MTNVRISNTVLILSLFSFITMMTACQSLVPASTPPQLNHTPGVALTITNNHIDTDWFTLDYPDGWRVVTNIALEPLRLTLVSPNDEMIIYVEEVHPACIFPESTPDPDFYVRGDCLGESETLLQIRGQVEINQQAIYAPIFDGVVNSVRFHQNH